MRSERKEAFSKVDLYPVTCQRLSAGRSNLDVLKAVIKGGSRIIQLRETDLPDEDLYNMALDFRRITRESGVLLVINDRVDMALAVDADGVHLGQDDLPVDVARKLGPELLVGASTHSVDEALRAQEQGADYINIGPIFPTETKDGLHRFLGPDAVTEIGGMVSVPFSVMGGINGSNIDQVVSRGAKRVAVVTAITQADDMEEAVRHLRQKIAG
ncbi:thiamine phosphate synthase [bacterium]|nr:MAG: thiamine phosphate synthase [bacterium]